MDRDMIFMALAIDSGGSRYLENLNRIENGPSLKHTESDPKMKKNKAMSWLPAFKRTARKGSYRKKRSKRSIKAGSVAGSVKSAESIVNGEEESPDTPEKEKTIFPPWLLEHTDFAKVVEETNICEVTRLNFKFKEYFRKERRQPAMSDDFNMSQYVQLEELDKLKKVKERPKVSHQEDHKEDPRTDKQKSLQERRKLLKSIIQNTATEQQLEQNQRFANNGKRYRRRVTSGSTNHSGGSFGPGGGDDNSSVASSDSTRRKGWSWKQKWTVNTLAKSLRTEDLNVLKVLHRNSQARLQEHLERQRQERSRVGKEAELREQQAKQAGMASHAKRHLILAQNSRDRAAGIQEGARKNKHNGTKREQGIKARQLSKLTFNTMQRESYSTRHKYVAPGSTAVAGEGELTPRRQYLRECQSSPWKTKGVHGASFASNREIRGHALPLGVAPLARVALRMPPPTYMEDSQLFCLAGALAGDDQVLAVMRAQHLQSSESLLTVSLARNEMTPAGVAAAVDELPLTLIEVDLCENKMNAEAVKALCARLLPAIQTLPPIRLQCLDLSRTGIGDYAAITLAQSLPEEGGRHLRRLNLSWNNIGDTGGVELVAALHAQGILEELDISRNGLRRQGDQLMRVKSLQCLDLSFNRLRPPREKEDPEGAPKRDKPGKLGKRLANALNSAQCRLVHLDLSHCGLGVDDAKHLQRALKTNHTLFGLHLDGVKLATTSDPVNSLTLVDEYRVVAEKNSKKRRGATAAESLSQAVERASSSLGISNEMPVGIGAKPRSGRMSPTGQKSPGRNSPGSSGRSSPANSLAMPLRGHTSLSLVVPSSQNGRRSVHHNTPSAKHNADMQKRAAEAKLPSRDATTSKRDRELYQSSLASRHYVTDAEGYLAKHPVTSLFSEKPLPRMPPDANRVQRSVPQLWVRLPSRRCRVGPHWRDQNAHCWLCGGWSEVRIVFDMDQSDPPIWSNGRQRSEKVQPKIYVHLACDDYAPCEMQPLSDRIWQTWRVLPPGEQHFFFTMGNTTRLTCVLYPISPVKRVIAERPDQMGNRRRGSPPRLGTPPHRRRMGGSAVSPLQEQSQDGSPSSFRRRPQLDAKGEKQQQRLDLRNRLDALRGVRRKKKTTGKTLLDVELACLMANFIRVPLRSGPLLLSHSEIRHKRTNKGLPKNDMSERPFHLAASSFATRRLHNDSRDYTNRAETFSAAFEVDWAQSHLDDNFCEGLKNPMKRGEVRLLLNGHYRALMQTLSLVAVSCRFHGLRLAKRSQGIGFLRQSKKEKPKDQWMPDEHFLWEITPLAFAVLCQTTGLLQKGNTGFGLRHVVDIYAASESSKDISNVFEGLEIAGAGRSDTIKLLVDLTRRHPSLHLRRCEWLRALCKVAAIRSRPKQGQSKPADISDALDDVIDRILSPKVEWPYEGEILGVPEVGDVWRGQMLYCEAVDAVLRLHYAQLRVVFDSLVDPVHNYRRVRFGAWTQLLRQAKVYGSVLRTAGSDKAGGAAGSESDEFRLKFGGAEAALCFVASTMFVRDQETTQRHKTMGFVGFLEALARVAELLYKGDHLAQKLTQLLEEKLDSVIRKGITNVLVVHK